MIILTVLRARLLEIPAVVAAVPGGIHLVDVAQNSRRPNLALTLISGADDWTHQGPDGLNQDIVRIFSRGDTFEQAAKSGRLVKSALNGWTGSLFDVSVQLVQHTNRTGDYQDAAKVFRQIDDFRVTYRG